MIVYLTFSKNCHVATEFFTLLTVEKCDASSLFEVLLNRLHSAAVDVSNIVGASMDGASVMLGKDNGLVARIREHVPHLFSGHYIAHRSMRRRRPAKSVKLAVVERGRKGKTKEGEDEAGTAGQNEEEEEDVEQELGDDQELVGEEEDNPFLSDDEDVEEVFDFGKPVH
ncbi:unnamed protein product [Closterium sp. NIES-54]